jgi:predicted nucleic acid-binding protein
MDPMMVLDTDVFIDHFRGQEAATTYIHSLPVEQRATTDITVMELYKGAANQQELATILRFLTHNRVTRLAVSTTASQQAVELMHQYGLVHGLGIPDALIAAITLGGRTPS